MYGNFTEPAAEAESAEGAATGEEPPAAEPAAGEPSAAAEGAAAKPAEPAQEGADTEKPADAPTAAGS